MSNKTQTQKKLSFDQYAGKYDAWFMENENLLRSEVALVAKVMEDCGRALSVGSGSGLFESFLKKDYDIAVAEGLEPSESMAEIAEKRGMRVTIGTAEEGDMGTETYDTILFNGTPSYISDLQAAFEKAWYGLKKGGKIVVIDVPKEGSFAMLYNLAKTVGTWDDELFRGIKPPSVYPIEFVKDANWRTTGEKVEELKQAGFGHFEYAQTLTRHPLYANDSFEEPQEGYEKGDYVAIRATK
ncbi:MAG: class I SAM-dependent methyltransferase [Bacteroidales bacterium]|nr:class I SAM-dependent methyltransferase [Bacteroidales bacterium]